MATALSSLLSGTKRRWTSSAFRRLSADVGYVLLPIAVVAVTWQAVAKYGGYPAVLFPSIGDILRALMHMAKDGTLYRDVLGSFSRLLKSIFIGAAVGTVIGALMGYFRAWEKALVVPLNFLLAVPGTALFPLTMMFFGLTEMAIISILIYEVALTVVSNTWTGVKSIDLSLIRAGRAFGATGSSLFLRVLLPAALPHIIAGYRIAFSRAWRILIVAEMLVSVNAGLGYRLYWARELFQTDVIYAGLIVIGLVGLITERAILRTLEQMTVHRWGTLREL